MRVVAMTAAASALVLAACGDRQSQTVTNPQTGESVTVESGSGARAPANMPDFAPLYPGATIENSMTGTSSGESGANRGGMVTLRVNDGAEQVAAFYRQALDRSNLSERNELNINGVLMITGNAPDDPNRALQVSIAPNTDGPGSLVTLVYSLGEG